MSKAAAALLLGLLCWAPARAEERVLKLDPEATEIHFTLGATLHKVEGSFQLREGEIRFDPETGAAGGRVVVDATSGDSDSPKRDRDMHAKVLESDRFPDFVFLPERFEGRLAAEGPGEVTLHGILEVRGEGHEVSLEAQISSREGTLEAETTFEVPYVEWGMKDPSKLFLRVEKQVTVTVKTVGQLED